MQSVIKGLREMRRGKQTLEKIASLCTYGMQPKGEALKAQMAKVPPAKLAEASVTIATLCIADVLSNPENPKNANMKAAIDGCLQFASRDLGVQKKDISKQLMDKVDAVIVLSASKSASSGTSIEATGGGSKRASKDQGQSDKKDKKIQEKAHQAEKVPKKPKKQ